MEFSICQRHVSVSQAASPCSWVRTMSKTGFPTACAISYFSFLRPYVPAMPQQVALLSRTSSPGMSRSRSKAGVPMPWLLSWQGAW